MDFELKMQRRKFILASSAAAFSLSSAAQSMRPIADSHNHLGIMTRKDSEISEKIGAHMRESGVSLLSWTIAPDAPFLGFSVFSGIVQNTIPAPGQLKSSFDKQLERVLDRIEKNDVKIVKTVGDLDKAATGVPHVVLTSEGADFLEGDLTQVADAYAKGIRHIQLVHYIKNLVGDMQTDKPVFNGLSDFGKSLVPSLNQAGILIDVAHSTPSSVDQALELSKVPLIWSHGFVSDVETPWQVVGYKSRGLAINHAKKIANKGGAIGLWALGVTVGGNLEGYATEIMRMVDLLGVEHVMFGSDEDGLPFGAVMKDLIDLKKVVEILDKRGMSSEAINAIAFGNYARCLRNAMNARVA